MNGHASLWFFTCSSTLWSPICKTSSVSVKLHWITENTSKWGDHLMMAMAMVMVQWKIQATYTELELAFCGVTVAVELRAAFFSSAAAAAAAAAVVLALLLFLLFAFDTFDDFFAGSFALPLEADCLESLDLPVEELSITTWPAIEDSELLVWRPVDLAAAAFFDALIVGDIFSHLGFGYERLYKWFVSKCLRFFVFLFFRCLQFFGLCCCCFMCAQQIEWKTKIENTLSPEIQFMYFSSMILHRHAELFSGGGWIQIWNFNYLWQFKLKLQLILDKLR